MARHGGHETERFIRLKGLYPGYLLLPSGRGPGTPYALFLPLAWWTSSALSTLRGGYFSVGWMTLFSSTVGRGCPGYLL